MAPTREQILETLAQVAVPGGGDLVSRDMIRALMVATDGKVSFLIEAPSADLAGKLEPVRQAAEAAVTAIDGVAKVTVILTAHDAAAKGGAASKPAPTGEPPQLKIGQHPQPQDGPKEIVGVKRVVAIASGKGGVGKSTVTSNLAVALAAQGLKVGLIDADVLGPSQQLMMGTKDRPKSDDGKIMDPVVAHGVKLVSIGLFVDPDQAVVWRGPLITGTIQQFLFSVNWGELDVLLIDLPPGTGDVQITLSQKVKMTGALVVSTPQDVALIDAHKAIDMFQKVRVPVLGLIENMAMYVCPNCGNEDHVFGEGGVQAEADRMKLPLLAAIPLAREVRVAGDAGLPIALGEGPVAEAYRALARNLVERGLV
ncbi:Mrp/NBP35 family ATP-binding protein [Maritimibacter sp. HL-12]|jgi:ATP-binding protein involved in chromosome partitioning|uniref:Mrp/NBP35 family ATP-binding protein n=1 Tax=Maritimibacter sp. HL-12 TaxID=1162418 RepID=UPI000A0F27A7|nr:Mrp/NBP35 family ATP-binding protein [Maritimibacter sp. HL-12]SMH53876.1 ATP-binding protein involved in chromosome partitioning [Maritimibacter sp. HL-12]